MYSDPKLTASHASDVAIKLLKPTAFGTQDEQEFFAEMNLMKEIGKHKNVVSLVGVVTIDQPLLLVVEFAEYGDLKNYLRDRRATETKAAQLTVDELLLFAIQIAHGMDYLSLLKIVHRDLAARNVLVCVVMYVCTYVPRSHIVFVCVGVQWSVV
jgi:epidermal growth factor receptor